MSTPEWNVELPAVPILPGDPDNAGIQTRHVEAITELRLRYASVTGPPDELVATIVADPESVTNAAILTTVGGRTAVVNVAVDGVYPTRPDAPVVAWVGDVDPDVLMGDYDYWVDPAAPPPVTADLLESELLAPGSNLGVAAGRAAGLATTVAIPAANLVSYQGSPALTTAATTFLGAVPVWRFDPDTAEYVAAVAWIPDGWSSATVTLVWAPVGTSGGFVRWVVTGNMLQAGALVSAGMATMAETNRAAPAVAHQVDLFEVSGALTVTGGELLRLTVGRRADNAADTNSDDAALIGVRLRRQS